MASAALHSNCPHMRALQNSRRGVYLSATDEKATSPILPVGTFLHQLQISSWAFRVPAEIVTPPGHIRTIESAVSSSILDRLQKLENYCSKLADQTPPSSHSSPASAAGNSLVAACHPPSTNGDDKVGSTGPDSHAAGVTFAVSNVDCSSGKYSPSTVLEPITFDGNLLPDAVEETRRRVIRSLTESAVTETVVDIPNDTAKFWIESKL